MDGTRQHEAGTGPAGAGPAEPGSAEAVGSGSAPRAEPGTAESAASGASAEAVAAVEPAAAVEPSVVGEPDGAVGEGGCLGASPAESGAGVGAGGGPVLTDEDRAVLDFAGRGWPSPGEKERAVRERLGMSPVRYYQYLNALLDDPEALRYAPVTVNRLRRLRQANRDRTR